MRSFVAAISRLLLIDEMNKLNLLIPLFIKLALLLLLALLEDGLLELLARLRRDRVNRFFGRGADDQDLL